MFKTIQVLLILFIGLFFFACSSSLDQEESQAAPGTQSALVQPAKWWETLPRPIYASLEKIETAQTWFEVYKLRENTYAFYEPYQFEEAISYLVIGTKEAVIIDTGTGIGDLKGTAQNLTDLPLSVVNTHTHWDHIGDNYHFDKIACFDHQECIRKLQMGVDKKKMHNAISGDSIWSPLPEGFDPETWVIPPVEPTLLLKDGDVIDLGERPLEVIYTPGHSPGSICLLDVNNRLLFTGDTFFPGPLYAYPEDVNIDEYMASIEKLKSRVGEYDFLLAGHNDPWVKSEVILRVSAAFKTVMAGHGEFKEDNGLRRYFFDGFDILIRTDMIPKQKN